MFAKIFTIATLASVALAGNYYPAGAETTNSCNVGEQYCCNSLQDSSSVGAQKALGLLQVAVGSVTGLIGVQCSPATIIGVAGNSCNAAPTCCTGNNFNGAVVLGCTPINANL